MRVRLVDLGDPHTGLVRYLREREFLHQSCGVLQRPCQPARRGHVSRDPRSVASRERGSLATARIRRLNAWSAPVGGRQVQLVRLGRSPHCRRPCRADGPGSVSGTDTRATSPRRGLGRSECVSSSGCRLRVRCDARERSRAPRRGASAIFLRETGRILPPKQHTPGTGSLGAAGWWLERIIYLRCQ
jgi:hypothetical protein